MKRLKAIFSAIRTLGRNPHTDITEAWDRVQRDLVPPCDIRPSGQNTGGLSSTADRHLVAQAMFGVADEAEVYLKKQGEQAPVP
mgnify:CR=1 FL=1